jgi:hypothetical protein
MDAELRRRLEQSGYGRSGFAEHYDRYRPRPPLALLELLPPLAGVERPSLVSTLAAVPASQAVSGPNAQSV